MRVAYRIERHGESQGGFWRKQVIANNGRLWLRVLGERRAKQGWITLRIIESERKTMTKPKHATEDFDAFDCSTASVLCDACMGEGGKWDNESIDQWYACKKCNGFGRVFPKPKKQPPVLYWVLVGHWEGTPFPIMRGQVPPPFSVWSVTDREQWERLRSENYYTRRSKSRPVAKVDREFQKQTGKDVWED